MKPPLTCARSRAILTATGNPFEIGRLHAEHMTVCPVCSLDDAFLSPEQCKRLTLSSRTLTRPVAMCLSASLGRVA